MKLPSIKPAEIPTQGAVWADDRFAAASPLRRTFNKVFPDHWSFLLGEIALYSFIVLLLSGTFLTLFYDPSMKEVVYDGSYSRLRGVSMSRAYETSLDLSFDVRGGLFMRQLHHWAALLFMASMLVHMFRTFFTGAFRRPRELNWVVGILLFTLGMVEGLAGYSLPDDALSGTGLSTTRAIVLAIPVVGTWIQFAMFAGEFPGELIISRLYIVHVLLIPGILLALITVHMALLVKQKHTQFPGPGRTESNVVGHRMFPGFAAKGGGFFMIVFAALAALAGTVQINPIWLFGPYKAWVVSAGSQPDWYMGWLDGFVRLFPAWEYRGLGHTIPSLFFPAVVGGGITITLAAVYPFLEPLFTKDRRHHNLLQRPRDAPVRTAIGAMAIGFWCVLQLSGANDLIAAKFDLSLNAMTWAGRIGLIVVPPLAYAITYRICLGLQQNDREVLTHGVETGIIRRLPSGEFVEVHQPLTTPDEHGHASLEYADSPVPKKMNKLGATGRSIKGFFVPLEAASDVPVSPAGPSEPKELSGAGATDQGRPADR